MGLQGQIRKWKSYVTDKSYKEDTYNNNGELKSIFCSFKENIKCLIFTNNDLGATLWGESLLPQRGREGTQLTFFPHWLTKNSSFLSLWQLNKTLKLKCFTLLLLLFLSTQLLTSSYSLCLFFFSCFLS